MSKTFTHAGVSRLNGSFKARFANDALRVKVLAKGGHTDIDLIELKDPMTKEDAVAYLLSIDFDQGNKEVRACLEAELDKRTPKAKVEKAPKAAKPKAEKKAKAAKPTLEKIRAKAPKSTVSKAEVAGQLASNSDLEDAPF